MTPETPLEIRTDGRSLIVTPAAEPTAERMALFLKAKQSAEQKLAPVLESLAK
ncbi:MAG: hypothetical protein IT187_03855 [Geothrix sp.]|nr:hypothetical protein [Geothrix sp.]